jgi:hypothetical protein
MSNVLQRFMTIFVGLNRAYGQYHNNRARTIRSETPETAYERHLQGVMGLGLVPICSDSQCYWGAIDIDIDNIDHEALYHRIQQLGLPLVVCRSKSGGAHLYTFVESPLPAAVLRKYLSKWASDLGYGKSEIFPKQDNLAKDDIGNWINLPYFDHKGENLRPAIGKTGLKAVGKLTIEQFLDAAERIRTDNAVGDLPVPDDDTYDGMPPCLQWFYSRAPNACDNGRNEVLYNYGVFLHKSRPEALEDELHRINHRIFVNPLPSKEVMALVKSVKRKDYRYKCRTSMIQEHCDAVQCKKLPHGIEDTSDKYGELMVGCLTKYLTDPPRWVLDINGIDVEFTSDELMDYRVIRRAALERADIVAPPMKNEEWLLILKERMTNKKTVEAPKDASVHGHLMQALIEFIQIADRSTKGKEDLLRGIPVKDKYKMGADEVMVAFFRSQDFIAYLKRKKMATTLTNNVLWMRLRSMGCDHTKIRITAHKQVQVWFVVMDDETCTPRLEPIREEAEI